jgi:hypothetical protein
MLILDILLLADFVIVVGTGILISQELFVSAFNLSNPYLVSAIHHSSAAIGLILISIHIGLHWPCIMSIVKNKLHLKNANRLRTVLSRVIAVAIMILGVQSSYNQNVFAAITGPLSTTDISFNTAADNEDIVTDTSTGNISQTSTAFSVTAADDITLEEYLSSLYCTACPKHCPLSSPQCSKGISLAQEATTEYYALYGDSSTAADTPSAEEDITDEYTDSEENNSDEGASHQNGKRRSQKDSSEQENEDSAVAAQNDNVTEDIPTAAARLPIENALDYISIMGLYIGGTHYLVKIPKKKK